jgi:hypothetical protein
MPNTKNKADYDTHIRKLPNGKFQCIEEVEQLYGKPVRTRREAMQMIDFLVESLEPEETIRCESCIGRVKKSKAHRFDGYMFCPECWTEYGIRHKISRNAIRSKGK